MVDDRQIVLEGAWNFRDIGGYSTIDGFRVKKHKLYRSDELSKLTPNDVQKLVDLGLKTIVDFRGERERENNEDVFIPGVRVVYLDPKADVAAMASSEMGDLHAHKRHDQLTAKMAKSFMIEQNKEFVKNENSKQAYRALIDLVLDDENCPLVQHCRGGKDRTGFGVALILFLLGVSKEDILEDYMLTNVYKKEKNEKSLQEIYEKTKNEDLVLAMRYMKEATLEFINAALDLIEQEYGSVEHYCRKELNVTDQEIDQLKKNYLERG